MMAADDLALRLERHTDTLGYAQERSGDLLETLEQASVSATAVKDSISQQSGWSSWWPYIICPSASLVMGSYGLPPSAFRNLALITLGTVSSTNACLHSTDRDSRRTCRHGHHCGPAFSFCFFCDFPGQRSCPRDIQQRVACFQSLDR